MNTLRCAGIVVLAGFCGLVRADAPADLAADVQQKITALEKIIMQEAPPPPAAPAPAGASTNAAPASTNAAPATPDRTLAPLPPGMRYIHALRQETLRKDYTNALAAANNIAGADSSDVVQKAVAALVPELQKLKDDQDASMSSGTKDLLSRAAGIVKTSKEPKELDAIIAELGRATDASRNPYNQGTYQEMQSASRFVKEWQTYLADSAGGNTQQASNDLRSLASMTDSFMPIPRSELLERASKVAATEPAVIDAKIEVHSLDDLPAAIAQIQAMQRSGGYNQDYNELLNAMQNLRNAWLAYQDKNYTGALQSMQMSPFSVMAGMTASSNGTPGGAQGSLRKELIALKDQLVLEIVQGMLAMPDAPAPDKDEHATDYLLRVAGLKAKAADWTALQQVLTVYGQVGNNFYNQQAWLQEDMAALHSYLIGEKLEAAGQTLDAIRSYRQSLATLGKFFPADPPAAKLKELEKKYPDLYAQALQQPITKTP